MSESMRIRGRWTTEEYQLLIVMWEREDSVESICKRFGLGATGVYKALYRLRKNGVPLKPRKKGPRFGRTSKNWTQEEVQSLIRMREQGLTLAEITIRLDRSFGAVQSMHVRLREEGIAIAKRSGSGRVRLWDADALRAAQAGKRLRIVGSDSDE